MKRSLLCAGLLTAVISAVAHAQGAAVMSHSACVLAMGTAGVAAPCGDGSAILFSPAALVLEPSVVSVGVAGISTSGTFTYDVTGETAESPENTTAVPFGYASYRPDDRWAVGIGVFAPYGLVIPWDESFEGRFTSYNTDLKNIYVQPTVAYKVDPVLSLGAGVDVVRSSISIDRHLDLSLQALPTQPFPGRTLTFGNLGIPFETDFARLRLSGDGTGVGYHLGALVKLTDDFSLGLRYLSKVRVKLNGTADFTQLNTGITLPAENPLDVPAGTPLDAVVAPGFATGGPLADQDISTTIELPAQFVAGVGYRPHPTLTLAADFQWTGWSTWNTYTLHFANAGDEPLVLDFQDTETYHLGAEWRPIWPLALRAGYEFSTAAEKDFSVSPLLPEGERDYYSLGAGLRFAPRFRLDVGYQLVKQADRRGRVLDRTPEMTAQQLEALNGGVYSVDAHVLNASLVYEFGPRR
jgi:long-chain fatty acid transport protein